MTIRESHTVEPAHPSGTASLGSTPFVIQTHGLTKRYRGVDALVDVDLKVPRHAICGFLGPNGAGKSTAIRLLLGLARPTAGTGAVFGHDIVADSLAIRRRVGYLAQDPRYYGHMTARQTLRFAIRFYFAGPREAIEARIEETLALVGLDDKADRPIRGFSGGERQRLGIAQAQVHHPELLILDEPAAALDPMGRRDVLAVMERLRRHATIFYSTHLLDDVQRVSDTVAILNHGRLVAQGPIGDLLAGGGGAVFALTTRGLPTGARTLIASQPWVSSLTTADDDGLTHWEIGVTDETAAERDLLRLVQADGPTPIVAFGRKRAGLDEVFFKLVEGASDDR